MTRDALSGRVAIRAVSGMQLDNITFYVLLMFFALTISEFLLHHQLPTAWPASGPQDDVFIELLFAAMCRDLAPMPGESFIEQARRWIDALRFIASLKPRDEPEWLQAIEVTSKQFAAIRSLLMLQRKGITKRQRARHDRDFQAYATAMQDARLRYDLLRKSRPE